MASSSSSNPQDMWIHHLSGTSVKLNGKNYQLWSISFQVFLGVHWKIRHVTHDPPYVKDPSYDDWFANDCRVIASLMNSMEESIACGIMMLSPTKKIWDTLKNTYGHEKNIS